MVITAETTATPEKEAMAVIAAMLVTAGTLLITTAEITAISGKGAMVIIVAIPVIARTPLVITAEIVVIPGTRSDQIDPLKGAGSTSNLKVRFCDDVIVIKESNDIDITALNDKTTILEITMLETL